MPLARYTQEDIAFRAVMEMRSTTPPGDRVTVFVDTVASHDIYGARRISAFPTYDHHDRLGHTCTGIVRYL